MRTIAADLPQLAAVLDDLSTGVAEGTIDSSEAFIARCRRRWDTSLIAQVDAMVPGWSTMASFADGKTLWHVNLAMAALYRLDEYLAAQPELRRVMEWTVLLHDIAKEPTHDHRDHRHAFRSAARAAVALPHLGFTTTDLFPTELEGWRGLVHGAWKHDPEAGEPIADNRFLPDIVAGVDRMFAGHAIPLLKAIALHQSVTVVADWPSLAPLTQAEERAYISTDVAALQLPLMLADNGGWNLFDPPTLHSMYAETRAVFSRIAAER